MKSRGSRRCGREIKATQDHLLRDHEVTLFPKTLCEGDAVTRCRSCYDELRLKDSSVRADDHFRDGILHSAEYSLES